MALDRWIALFLLLLFALYAYGAFFTIDHALPPFMQRNPIWPSTFPKVLSVLGALASLTILFRLEKSNHTATDSEINYRRLTEFKLFQALSLIGLMVLYALTLQRLGFLISTSTFLIVGPLILGERRFFVLLPVAFLATGSVWYLVDQVLGIFMRPLPMFLS